MAENTENKQDSGNNEGKEQEVDELLQTLENDEERDKELLGPLFENGGQVTNSKCPNCGSEDRVFKNFYEYLVRHGKMKAGREACSNASMLQYSDPTAVQLVGSKIPTFTMFRDICRGCGLEYPTKIIRQDQVDVSTVRFPGQMPGQQQKR